MTIYTWVGGGGGAWNVGGNWDPSTGFPNGFADEAIIPAGATTVAISGASYTVGVLQMYAGTTLALTNSATLTVYAPDPFGDLTTLSGTISVDGTSVLQFANAGWTTADLGTIDAASGAILFFETSLDNSGATLALAPGVILEGEIDGGTITGAINFAASGFVTLVDGPVLKGAGGTGSGLVQDIANGSTLRLQDTTTISNTTINIGNATNTAFLSLRDTKGGGQLVTLATDVTVNVANFAAFNGGAYANDTLDNKGAINVTAMGASLTISTPIFTNDGTITIANGDTLQFSNSLLTNKGTISVDDTSTIHFAGLTTAQLGTLNATAANPTAGTAGATVDFGGTGLNNTGAVFKPVNGVNYEGAITGGTIEGGLILAAFAKLELDGSPVVTGAFGTGAGFIDAANGGSTLALGSTQTIDNATILLGNSVISQVADNTITTFGPNVTIDILGNTTFQGSQTGAGIVNQGAIDDSLNESFPTMVGISFTNEGSMTFSNHDGFVVDNSVTFKNAAGATITASAGANGQSYILFQGSIVNDGTITVDGFGSIASEIDYYHAVTGTGTTDITGGGLADFFESMTQSTRFTGGGQLQLNSNTNTGIVSSFGSSDSINLTGLIWQGTSASWTLNSNTDVLTVTEGGLSSDIHLNPAGDYTGYVFTLSDDHSGLPGGDGTLVTVVPCFCRGTRIATKTGEVAVEELRVGDLVATASGAWRPVRWIGHRSLDTTRHPTPRDVYPIRVQKDAFGEGRPRRDLWLSPGHNIVCDGVLITAASLANGVSVAQIERRHVEYWHVELDTHDILIAEGLEAESYLESGNRSGFDNGGTVVDAHPDFQPRRREPTCLPLAGPGQHVERAKARLRERLIARGYAVTDEAQTFLDADGACIDSIELSSTRLAFVTNKVARTLTLVSRSFVPLHTLSDAPDDRQLGLCISRVQIDGVDLAIDGDEAPGFGWHEAETRDGAFTHRWTTGAAQLPAGARVIIIDLAGQGAYWREPNTAAVAMSA